MNSKNFQNWLNVSSNNFKKGIHFGHKSIKLSQSRYWHPLLSDSFLGIRDNVSIINTQQTFKSLLRAFHVLAQILNQKGRVLIVNTNPEFFRLSNNLTSITLNRKSSINDERNHQFFRSTQLQTPLISYVNYKWIGGTLTNWKQVSKSVLTFAKFSERCQPFLLKNEISFPKFTRVKKCFQGLLYRKNHKMVLGFNQKPDLLFLVNPNENRNILNEAFRLHIPVIALTESSTNPKGITYPIPVNNYSIKFIYYCLKKILKMAQSS